MNNSQLYLSIGIPSVLAILSWVTIVLAWLSNRTDINRLGDTLRAEMLSLRHDISAHMLACRREIAAETIAFRKEVHGDLIMLHERVVKVETRQEMQS